ncbi:hypothetical protein OQA88_6381 [Cercophora sp. LCS_1]
MGDSRVKMPLLDITNSQGAAPLNRKRSHDEFVKDDGVDHCTAAPAALGKLGDSMGNKENIALLTPAESGSCSPEKRSPGLTASGSSPLEGNSPSPNATPKSSKIDNSMAASAPLPTQVSTTKGTMATKPASSNPPAKRKKVTPEEKAAKEAERKEKEEAKAKKKLEKEEAEKKKAAEKAEKQLEKERKRLEKEEADKKKAVEKAEKLQQAEKDKASQKKISDMFGKGRVTPKKASPIIHLEKPDCEKNETSPLKTEIKVSPYLQYFKPFYIKDQVRLADQRYGIDEETRETKASIILEFMEGKRQYAPTLLKDNALELLQLPSHRRRGRVYPSVRKLMTGYQGASSLPIDLTTDSQKSQICHTREALQAVPLKSLKFREDVRPPYIGTVSGLPEGFKSLRLIALHPTAKAIPSLNYDYDSEAEWQEEDGEDVEDLDDEEDEADNDEEMSDFLDDSEDAGPSRLIFSGGMEPESTGLCWENRKRLSSPAKMYKFRMELILDSLAHHSEIDPFSSSYWDEVPTKAETQTAALTAAAKPSTSKTTKAMAPPPAPTDAFGALASAPVTKPTNRGRKAEQPRPLPDEYHAKLKALLVEKPTFTKTALLEWFGCENPGVSKLQIKTSFDLLTTKEFNELFNMTSDELEDWLETSASTGSGWTKDDGSGESVGHESGRHIVDILQRNPSKDPNGYDEADIPHKRKVVIYCKRHLAQEGTAKQNTGSKSCKSLKNWDHDALKE